MGVLELLRGRRMQAVGLHLDGIASAARAVANGEAIDLATLDSALAATSTTPEAFDSLVARCRLRGEDRRALAAAAVAEAKLAALGPQIEQARAVRDRLFEQHDKPLREMVREHNALMDQTQAGAMARESLYRNVPGQAGAELSAADAEWRSTEQELSRLTREAHDSAEAAETSAAIALQNERKNPAADWEDTANRAAARSARRAADAAAAAIPAATAAAKAARDRLREAQARALEA
jgi:chromosome segregation ATPase